MRLLPKWNRKTDKQVKIPWSIDNAHVVSEAKTAIKDAEPKKALDILAGLHNPALDKQLTHLNNQLARYRRESIQGTQAFDEKNVTFNRISARILDLINTIEEGLAFEEKEYKEVKDYLRQRYQNRLNQKLAGRQPVNLRRLPSTEGTSKETSAIFKSFGVDEIRDEITKAFHDTRGRLLIVGKPGTGKTVLMLQLVIRLLDTEKDALPVVLNLASWQSSFGRLENWLEKIIPSELGVNTNFAKKITEQYRLILLLDGFDEIREEVRASCLEAIGKYGVDASRQFVIASRINEYKAVAADAPVYGQIEVGPLTIGQVEAELEGVGHGQPEALRLLNAIRKDELLREAVQTPFYFNTLQLMFADGKRWSDFGFSAGTVEGRQREVMERFIESGLAGDGEGKYISEQVRNWLSFFANRMKRHNLVAFELRDLQYDWWHWSRVQITIAHLIHSLALSVMITLVGVLTGFLVGILIGGLTGRLLIGLVSGLLSGLAVSLNLGLLNTLGGVLAAKDLHLPLHIDTKDSVRWSLEMLLWGIKYNLGGGLIWGLIIATATNPSLGMSTSLIVGLVGWMSVSLTLGIYAMIVDPDSTYFLQINTPYQRFKASMRALHFSILQHWLLRYQLYRQGLLPLRLVDFLNDMATRHFLETDGATWRFRHRLIQDYFAGMWEEPEQEH